MVDPLPDEVLYPPPGPDGKRVKRPQKADRKHLLSTRALQDLERWRADRLTR
jgi:hypothetical protein